MPQRMKMLSGLLLLVLIALLVGNLVAHEKWVYVGLIVALIVSFLAPIEVALGSYVLLIPFDAVAALGQGTSAVTVNRVLGALAAVALLGTGVVKGRLHRPPRAALWWTLFVVWGGFSVFWALQPEVAVHALPTAFSLLGLYLVATSWEITDKQYFLLIKLAILGACLASCFVIYQFSNGVTWKTWQGGASERASLVMSGREANPNRFGADLLLPFALTLGLFLSAGSKRTKLLALGAAAIIAYAAFLTMSRGSLLAILLIVALFAYHKKLARHLLPVAVLLSLLMLAMPSAFFERLITRGPTTGSGRLDIWYASLPALRKYALAGCGIDNFSTAYNEFAGRAASFIGFDRAAHNLYLEAGVELGVIGLVLLCLALFYHLLVVRQIRRTAGRHSIHFLALEIGCWAALANSFFEGGLWDKSFWLIWMLCLMAVSFHQRDAREQEARKAPAILPYRSYSEQFLQSGLG